MNGVGLLARLAYRAVRPAACVASLLLPESLHLGKRARRAVTTTLQVPVAGGRFARLALESAWRAHLLELCVSRLRAASLDRFFQQCVDYDGAVTPAELLSEQRPIIFATPHYGAAAVGAGAGAHLLRGRRALKVFYDEERHGERVGPLFERVGLHDGDRFGGLAGLRAALRALARGECLAILPDAFDDIAHTLVVPFLGRLLRVAPGTAFLALRSRALIVPVFAAPRVDFGLRVTFGAPIDPARITADDESQALFTLTLLLFQRIEEQLRLAPEHWRYWEALPHVSTPLGAPSQLDRPQLLQALRAKLHALPPAARDIPEVELMLE